MAEAVMDEEHPLADYLLDAGDAPAELMPGGAAEFLVVEADTDTNIWLPPFIHPLVETVHEMTQSHRSRSAAREFAERFKYVIISSSLLSSTLAPPASATIRPQPRSSSPLPPTPGKWNDPQLAVGRPESISLWTISLCIAPAALLQGYYIGALLILATARLYETNGMADSTRQASLLQNLEALDSLIAAGNFWDSVVCEAMAILEKEERTLFYGTATPGSPSSSLRVALHSTLQTTTTQCDNVRQLFSPLTSPTELAQMTEMYAPLTPLKATFSAHSTNFFDNPRPLSLSGSPSHWVPPSSAGPSTPTPMADKRATWNGQQQMIKDRRRSALATLLGEHASPMARSQPPTPRAFDDEEPFGVTALDLTRNKRRSLRLTGAGGHSTPISASGSRFTAMQTTRHPLSLSSLNHALQAALSSKRYSTSHLLALRFGEEEEEYWEDVRSVISLLTTTFEDAASRLSEALEDSVRKQRLEEDEPLSTPLTQQAGGILSYSDSPSLAKTFSLRRNTHQRGSARSGAITASTSLSFAPMPSRLLKFSSHIDAIASALDIAKERLQECMTALQEEQTRAQQLAQNGEEAIAEGEDAPSRADLETAARAALESYENMRRELGFALRECERAREPLWDVVGVKASSGADEGDTPDLVRDVEEDGDEDDVPALAHDSSDSEPSRGSRGTVDLAYLASALAAATASTANDHRHHLDDFAPLPPATGLEQVFEADSAPVGAFNRERSKMTREERIAAAKVKRESGIGGSGLKEVASATMGGHGEVWGPGGEVVQELRDVIWKVGEKRRKVQEEHQSTLLESAAPAPAQASSDEATTATTSSMLRNRPRAPTRSVPSAPSQSLGSEAEMQLGKLRSMVSQAERGLGISIPSPVTPSTPYTTSAGGLTAASGPSPYTPHGVGGPAIEDLRAMVASVASKASPSPLIVEPTEDVFGPTASTSSAPIDIVSAKAQRRYSRQPVVGVAASPTGSGPRVSFSRPLSGSYAAAYSAAYSTGSQSPSASSSASFGSPLGSPSAAYNTLPSFSSTSAGVGSGGVRHRASNSSLSSFLRTVHLEPIPDPEGDEEEFEEASEVLLEADEEAEGQAFGVAL